MAILHETIAFIKIDTMNSYFSTQAQMTPPAIYKLPVTPAAVADEKGNAVTVTRVASPAWLERLLRPISTAMGCSAGFSSTPLTVEFLSSVVIRRSLSLAWALGQAVVQARVDKEDIPVALAATGRGRVIFRGKGNVDITCLEARVPFSLSTSPLLVLWQAR